MKLPLLKEPRNQTFTPTGSEGEEEDEEEKEEEEEEEDNDHDDDEETAKISQHPNNETTVVAATTTMKRDFHWHEDILNLDQTRVKFKQGKKQEAKYTNGNRSWKR